MLPSPQNLQCWVQGDPTCPLCSDTDSLRHILSGSKISLSRGLYGLHGDFLKSLEAGIESRRRRVNSGRYQEKSAAIRFVREGEKSKGGRGLRRQESGHLKGANDWEMQVDLGGKLVPQEIVCSNLRPDTVLWSVSQRRLYFVELTVPWEDSVEEAYERKKLRYADLAAEAEQRGWQVRVCPVQLGCRGFIARSTILLLGELGVCGQSL